MQLGREKMKDLSQVLQLFFLYILFTLKLVNSDAIMGPADIKLKYGIKCKWTLPTFVDINLQVYQRKGKDVLSVNATLPCGLTDDIGFSINMAVKRNGGFKPNFMKFTGKGSCNAVKAAQYKLFKLIADQLKPNYPPSCPLPQGTFSIQDFPADPSDFQKKIGMTVLPYGEFRLDSNITYKDDVIACYQFFVDTVPQKKTRKG